MKIHLRSVESFPATLLVTVLLLLVLAACRHAAPEPEVGSMPGPGGAAMHAVHSQQLEQIMSDLSGITFERLPQELGESGGQRVELGEIAKVADNMVQAASRIPSAIDEVKLEPAEQKVFVTLADRLGTQASTLRRQARQNEMAAVRASLQEINATCISCHTLFRDPSAIHIGLPR